MDSSFVSVLSQDFYLFRAIENYIQKLSEKVSNFEESVNDLKTKMDFIDGALNELGRCNLTDAAVKEQFDIIQSKIDDFNFKEYSNLPM